MRKALVYSSDKIERGENPFWISLLQSFEKELWIISLNLENGEIICKEIVSFSNGNLLLRNPATSEKLSNALDKAIEQANAPDNEILNTIHALLRRQKKIITANAKSKKKPKHKGRPIENYLRRATLQVIKRKESDGKIKPIAEEIYPSYIKQTQSKKSFIAQVQRLYRSTKNAWEKETKMSGVSFEEFAKNQLKASRRLYKTKPKTTSRK
jgi:hypothetical protein